MDFQSTKEGVTIALEALRSNKVRAFLTILGVAIGVMTVMAMSAVVTGVQRGVTEDLSAISHENFVVARWDRTQPSVITPGRPPWGDNPKTTLAEAEQLSALPSVQSVTPFLGTGGEVKWGDKTVASTDIVGVGAEWTSYMRGDFLIGRNFLPVDVTRSANAAVITDGVAEQLFGTANPVGQRIRTFGVQFVVVGVFKPKPDLFSSGPQKRVYVPATTAKKNLPVNDNWMDLWVVPAPGYSQEQTMDEVTAAMRGLRRLGPGEDNNFALIRQEAFADLINGILGMLAMVMIVLSAIGLMVGGVGVIGIMMISVTERTREIGVRKALGATRREILWQFLVEAVTVTVIGGTVGMLAGAGLAMLLRAATPIPAAVPLWAVVAAIVSSAVTGIFFGLYPASKASRLDPVEALRYE